jgi:hypothetical protein
MVSLECIFQRAKKKVGVLQIGAVWRIREKKWKVQTAVCQVMTSVLWDSEAILLLEFLKRGATISSEQYVRTLKNLKLKGSA